MKNDASEIPATDDPFYYDPSDPRYADLDPETARNLAWLDNREKVRFDENGIDLDQLRENLRLTPRQRLQRMESARFTLARIRKRDVGTR